MIAFDLFDLLLMTSDGFKNIYIFEDVASRWVKIFAILEAAAENCAKALLTNILRFGVPRRILSDHETLFVSAVVHYLKNCLDIRQIFCTGISLTS